MKQEMNTIGAYRSELESKRNLVLEFQKMYGAYFMCKVDVESDLLNLSFEELKERYTPLAE
jgi:hypothetical protein